MRETPFLCLRLHQGFKRAKKRQFLTSAPVLSNLHDRVKHYGKSQNATVTHEINV